MRKMKSMNFGRIFACTGLCMSQPTTLSFSKSPTTRSLFRRSKGALATHFGPLKNWRRDLLVEFVLGKCRLGLVGMIWTYTVTSKSKVLERLPGRSLTCRACYEPLRYRHSMFHKRNVVFLRFRSCWNATPTNT